MTENLQSANFKTYSRPNIGTQTSLNTSENFAILKLDGVFAVFVLFCFTNVFWQIISFLFPNFTSLQASGVGLLQSAILALGFIGIAIFWEKSIELIKRASILFAICAIALISVFWSNSAFETLQNGLNLFLILIFACAMGLRFGVAKISAIAAYFAISLLILEMLLSLGDWPKLESYFFKNNELALALVCSVWAYIANLNGRLLFAAFGIFCAIIAILSQDLVAMGGALGLLGGLILAFTGQSFKGGVISLAAAFATFIIMVLIYAVFMGDNALNALSGFYSQIDAQAIWGVGFGLGGDNIATKFGIGLGLIGFALGLMALFFAVFIAAFNSYKRPSASVGIFGFIAIIILGLGNINLISPHFILALSALFCGLKPLRL